ncbi:hypothetical protein H9636_18400 [Ureibacillus sp. Re31]|uniref:Uncharacterized protein n=1 Tax=Ureibacillus galli TaxID=2762222 RepID=A0ABR8XHG0_9BACL|nr:DUF6270 domain-containing protein [Ureibacillus galli]MBD8028609.1 hypothetical protein [Ureibacillus galli]
MTTIDILGSCVTRDAFAFVEHNFELSSYHPRSSLISIYSSPIHIKKEGIDLKSEYQQRLVYMDMTKSFYKHIKETIADILIIDFMDERLGVLKTNNTYITHSDELKLSKLKLLLDYEIMEFNDEYLEMWEISALKFTHDIKKRPFKKIILHKAFYMDTYINKDGEKVLFTDSETVKRIESRNILLNHMYQFIERNLQNITVIEPHGFSANENHKWGLTPFHYEQSYYQYFIDQLKQISKEL